MRTDFVLCISILRVATGPRMKLVDCKGTLTPPYSPTLVYTTVEPRYLDFATSNYRLSRSENMVPY